MTNTTIQTEKKTFTIEKTFLTRLSSYKNKSKIINDALRLYFIKKDFFREKEKEFFENLEFEGFSYEDMIETKSKLAKISDKLDDLGF